MLNNALCGTPMRPRTLLVSAILSAVVLSVALPASAAPTTRKLLDLSPRQRLAPVAVARVVPGDAEVVIASPGENGAPDEILARPLGGGVRITIFGSDFGRRIIGPISSDGRSVVFKALDPATGAADILSTPLAPASSGNVPITVQGSSFADASGAPSLPPGGASFPIVFKDVDAAGSEVIVARSSLGNIPITVVGQGFGPYSRPGVNAGGDVVVQTLLPGTGGLPPEPVALVRPRSGGNILTIRGSGFAVAPHMPSPLSPPRIFNDPAATVLISTVVLTPEGPKPMVLRSLRNRGESEGYQPWESVFDSGEASAEPMVFSAWQTNPQARGGQTNVLARYPVSGRLALIDLAPPAEGLPPTLSTPRILLSPGDAIDGSTIASIGIFESSLLSNGDALVRLELTDGTAGLYYVPIPEPTALGALLPIAGLLRRRAR